MCFASFRLRLRPLSIALGLLAAAAATGVAGCGSDKDCQSLCEEGQSGNCTSIDGDCGSFCDALDNVEDDSGCADVRADYEDCLNSESDVCDVSCSSEESALTQCVANYCVANPSSGDCQTLVSSF